MAVQSYSPSLKSYLPYLYIIWADGLLTASELAVVNRVISEDPYLVLSEKQQLKNWLNLDQPPADNLFEKWNDWINRQNKVVNPDSEYPLAEFSQNLTQSHGQIYREGLQEIEYNLGLQVQQYKHLFPIQGEAHISDPSFSVSEMTNILFSDTKEIKHRIHKVLNTPLFDWTFEPDNAIHRNQVKQQLYALAEQGHGALAFPEEYGGASNIYHYGQVFEELIYADASLAVKFGVQFGLFGGSVASLGSKKHHDLWLEKIGNANLLGCFAMTEESHGSNVRGLKTTATYLPAEKQIEINTPSDNDYKVYIGNALDAEFATVFAQLIVRGKNCGVHAIVVPLRDAQGQLLPGIKVEDNGYKLGLNGVDNGKIWFHQVKVPVFNLLDRFGQISDSGEYTSEIKNPDKRFFITLGALIGGRICVAMGANNGAKLGLAIAIRYGHQRSQFGSALHKSETQLMEYPSHQMRLIPKLAKTYVLHFALHKLLLDYQAAIHSLDKRQIETQAAALKVLATDHANTTLQECREACGGKGYMAENRIPQLRSDVDIFSTFEGDNTVLLQLTAKGIISEFQSQFNANSYWGLIKYVKTSWQDSITSYNPLFTNKIDASHLLSRDFHREAFTYRTRRLTFSIAQRMRNLLKKRVQPYQVFLKVQTHMLALAEAYAEELALRQIHKIIEDTTAEKERFLLKKISAMYAIDVILQHKAWYLEQGYISANKSKALRQLAHRQAQLLTPDSLALIEALNIPSKFTDLPILAT